MMNALFGTDGIRGEAGAAPLDRATLRQVGWALARNLPEASPRVLIGRDTRSSGVELEGWLGEGIRSGGGETLSSGVLTTPAIAILTKRLGLSAGVVISASHNPCPDNGVKIFSSDGGKSSQSLETAIEEHVRRADGGWSSPEASPVQPDPRFEEDYLAFLQGTMPKAFKLPPFKIVLDCANGAAYHVGPALLGRLGLEVVSMGVSPDGDNINRSCGSTHPEHMARLVVQTGADLGAALDGDGDRLILADHEGRIVNGDGILLLCARRLLKEGRLPGPGVVATVMSNLALEKALERERITLHRTHVGDKHVAEEMKRRGLPLGGEQSGHVIFSKYAPTGDGLLTLLQVLRVLAVEEEPLARLARLEPYPQVLVNVRVKAKPDLTAVPEVVRAVEAAEEQLKHRGRILIRYSGTEPLLRIMMEGTDEQEVRQLSEAIGAAARRAIGEP